MSSGVTRIVLYVVVFLLVVYKIPGAWQVLSDPFDTRPAVTVLFIGNSRTQQNNMPAMVRTIADSAHSKKKYVITMYTPNGSTMQDHWNDPKVRELLEKKWNYVVLQGQSGEQLTSERNASFETYGKALANLAQSYGSKVVLFVGWRYADSDPVYAQAPYLKPRLHDMIQEGYAELARTSSASVVNVGRVWEKLHAEAPQMPLYKDTNHPSIYGSYLTALMFYQFFSGDNLNNVTYIPDGISSQDAALIKRLAEE